MPQTAVRIRWSRRKAEVSAADGADDELRVQLALVPAAQLRAGVQPVQVVRPRALGLPPVPHIATESNVAALVKLKPRDGLFGN